jgi:hypothetical protein
MIHGTSPEIGVSGGSALPCSLSSNSDNLQRIVAFPLSTALFPNETDSGHPGLGETPAETNTKSNLLEIV